MALKSREALEQDFLDQKWRNSPLEVAPNASDLELTNIAADAAGFTLRSATDKEMQSSFGDMVGGMVESMAFNRFARKTTHPFNKQLTFEETRVVMQRMGHFVKLGSKAQKKKIEKSPPKQITEK
jgi:hypothetical protein